MKLSVGYFLALLFSGCDAIKLKARFLKQELMFPFNCGCATFYSVFQRDAVFQRANSSHPGHLFIRTFEME